MTFPKAFLNRRGIFSPTLFIFSLVILVYAFSIFSGNTLHTFTQVLGEKQANLTATYLSAEYDFFFIEKSADTAAYTALSSLASHGGMKNDCETVEGFSVWNSETCTFTEKDLAEHFLILFKPLFNATLQKRLNLTSDTFTYQVTPYSNRFTLIGTASEQLSYSYLTINYSFIPHFSRDIPFPLSSYSLLKNDVLSRIDCVKNTPFNPLVDTPETIPRTCTFPTSFHWSITKKNNYALFTALPQESSSLTQDISIRFAIDLNRITQL